MNQIGILKEKSHQISLVAFVGRTGFEPATLLMSQSGYATMLNYLLAKNRLAPIFFSFFSNAIDSCLVETIVCQTKLQGIPVRNDLVSPALCSINRFSRFWV